MSRFNQVFFKGKFKETSNGYQSAIYENIKRIFKSEASFSFDNKHEHAQLNASHISYGLEDMSLLSRLNTGEHIALRVKEKIELFEPRISNIYVHFETENHLLNTMRFSIFGDILIGNEKQSLMLDTNISLSNLNVSIDDEILNDQ